MSAGLNGSCLCGAVRYSVEGAVKFAINCHCTDCQKESGAGHLTLAAVELAALTITGEIRTYVCEGASGKPIKRTFCPVCGTGISGEPASLGGLVMLRAGTIDSAVELPLQTAIFCDSAKAWDRPLESLRQFPGMPPQR